MTLLIREFDHVGFTLQFLARVKNPDFARKAVDIVDRHDLDDDLAPAFERELAPFLDRRGVATRLAPEIRMDRTLTLNCSGALFANGRAAPLNQVMTFAVLKAASEAGNPVAFTQGRISTVTKQDQGFVVTGPTSDGAPCKTVFDKVILRHGPARSKRYAACAEFYDSYRRHIEGLRKTHGHMFVPPVLASETFAFFEPRYSQLLEHHLQDGIEGLRGRRQQTVQINWDQATHQPVQQGRLELLDIAARCEQLPVPCVIHLDLRPAQTDGYAEVLRQLVQFSNGRIALQVSSDFAEDWEGMSSMTSFSSPFPIRVLPALEALHAACDRSLMRQLGARLRATCAAGNCPKLGKIHVSIASQLSALWTAWDNALQADPAAMRHFLSHLEHATAAEASASAEKIEALSAALVLMLATELQQPLRPARAESGNFHFGAYNAVGLASGAESLQKKPIVDYCAPSDWGADALILSGAQEAMDFEDDSLSDAGSARTSVDRAERVRPAVIQASRRWRSRLKDGLPAWKAGVELEFSAWRERQDKQFTENEE
ncbi:ABC-three component system protein [Cupriavidus basilensis]